MLTTSRKIRQPHERWFFFPIPEGYSFSTACGAHDQARKGDIGKAPIAAKRPTPEDLLSSQVGSCSCRSR